MPRVVHFELAADDPEMLARFYTNVFGWKVQKWEGPTDYWLVMTGEAGESGIDGGISKRRSAGESTTNTIDVPSVDDYVEKIKRAGGIVVVPKNAVPGVGWLAYCRDPDGNVFGIMQSDMSAK